MTLGQHARRIPSAALIGSLMGFVPLAVLIGATRLAKGDRDLLASLGEAGGILAAALFGTLIAFPVCAVGLALVALPSSLIFGHRDRWSLAILPLVGFAAGALVGLASEFAGSSTIGAIWGTTSMLAWALHLPVKRNGTEHD